jgi:hypothetical protein
LAKCARPYLKNKLKSKRIGGITQVVECLHNKHKALSSNPSNEKKTKTNYRPISLTKIDAKSSWKKNSTTH